MFPWNVCLLRRLTLPLCNLLNCKGDRQAKRSGPRGQQATACRCNVWMSSPSPPSRPAALSPSLPLYSDMHIILADSNHLPGVGDIPSRIKLCHLGFVQKFSGS